MKHIITLIAVTLCLSSCLVHAADPTLDIDSIAAAASAPAVSAMPATAPVDPFVKIMAYITAFVFICRLIVKLTPTPKDDTFLDDVVTFLKHLGLSISDKPFVWMAALCMLSFSSCAMDPAVKQKLITDGTGILITGGEALLVSGGNGGAAFTAMSNEAVADIPGLKKVIAASAAKSAKNPATPVTISVTPAAVTP